MTLVRYWGMDRFYLLPSTDLGVLRDQVVYQKDSSMVEELLGCLGK